MSPDGMQETALDAVASLIATVDPGAMVQRFLLLAEVVDADGERVMWAFEPPDAKPWDALGLIEWARQIEQAAAVTE